MKDLSFIKGVFVNGEKVIGKQNIGKNSSKPDG
jgi:hypothetical protein